MKKKLVRKVASAKKTISRSPKKQKFSLKSWLLGGLVLLIALVYGYSQSQPKTLKVIELAGKIEDYISPLPVDINKVTIMSDSPEVNAYVAAAQVKKAAAEKATQTGTPVDQAKVEADMERAARQAAKATYQAPAADAMGIIPTKPTTGGKSEIDLKAVEDAVDAAVESGVKTANSINFVPAKDGEKAKYEFTPVVTGTAVNQNNACDTSNGGMVFAGSTVIGSGDEIYRCTATGWQGTGVKCNAEQVKNNTCSINVTVKPTYALNGGANCYDGNLIVGQGQVVDVLDGSKKQCSSGALVDAKKLNGQYLSFEDYDKKFKELMENCKNNGGNWQQTRTDSSDYYCGKGDSNTCASIGKVFSESTQGCVERIPVNDKADTKKTTPYSMEGCQNAIADKNKEECKRSADNPNLWLIVPKGGTAGNSGVPAKISSEINAGNTNYNGSIECANALKLKGAGYTCEPIAGGNYYKLTPLSNLPSSQRSYVSTNFGSDNTNTNPTTRAGEYTYPNNKSDGAKIRCNGGAVESVGYDGKWSQQYECNHGCWQGVCNSETSSNNTPNSGANPTTRAGEYTYPNNKSDGAKIRCNGGAVESVGYDGKWSQQYECNHGCWQGVCREGAPSVNEPTTYNNYYQLWNKPAKSYCYFSFQCADGLSCSDRKCGGESGTDKKAATTSTSIPTQETLEEYSGQYAYRDCMEAATTMGDYVSCNVSGTDGTYESYYLVREVVAPANQTNTSANKLKKPGESCNALGFLWFGSNNQCDSGICGRRESADIKGIAGNYCANESGNIPSAKVDYPEKSLSECKETLPSDQECVRNPETGYFYRSYK